MRDLVILAIVALGALVALRRPWIGVMLWTWISIMNPHRYAWGVAFDAPIAMVAALGTLVGFLITKDQKDSPFKGAPPVILALFMVWLTLSWRLGFDPEEDYYQWDKVMKINFMVLVSLALLRTKQHILALMWVCTLSLALLGAKGGLFTIISGGGHRVWGPAGSFIEDNNHFATALVMTVPLLRFMQMQVASRLGRHVLTAAMVLVAASAIGSHSRGALLAIAAMVLFLWWRGGSRLLSGPVIAVVALLLLALMPENWHERMASIQNYEEDSSAMGRLAAWWVAWGIAKDHLFGAGFGIAYPHLFAMYSPIPSNPVVAHSIYFQILGNHGFVGLGLFLALWVSTWALTAKIRKTALQRPETKWCHDLASMVQVAFVGYAVGGAFLNLAYFDLPYNLMVAVVLTHVWMKTRAWEREPVYKPGRWTLPGLAAPSAAQPASRQATVRR